MGVQGRAFAKDRPLANLDYSRQTSFSNIVSTKKEPAKCGLQMNLMQGSGRDWPLCAFRGWLRHGGGFRGFCLLLRGEFLLDLGCDSSDIHLVELGGFAQGFAGFVGRGRCLENGQLDQQTAQGAFIGLAKKR